MEIVAACPFPIGSVLWQPRAGAFVLTVVGKITLSLEPQEALVAADQEPLRSEDAITIAGSVQSLYAPSDLAPAKPRAEVLVVGHAHAPHRAPVRMLTARVAVGTIEKVIDVHADRAFAPDGSLVEGPPFTRMSIGHERAAGGPDTWNPAGVRRDTRTPQGHFVVPNLVPHGKRITGPMEPVEPVGLGPIAASWPVRKARLGGQTSLADVREWRGQPVPQGVDLAYFNVAPLDQQTGAFPDPPAIVLENLHPEHARLATRLPSMRWIATVERPDRAAAPVALRCDTLWIDADRGICTATFRAQIPLSRPDEPGRAVVSVEGLERAMEPFLADGAAGRASAPYAPNPVSQRARGDAGAARGMPAAQARWAERTQAPQVGASPALPFAGGPSPSQRIVSEGASRSPEAGRGKSVLPQGSVLALLWYSSEAMGRIRRRQAWKAVLREVEGQPIDPELDDPDLSASPAEVENRRDLGAILSRCEATPLDAIEDALAEGAHAGTFTPRIALFEGDLALPFDGVGVLSALVATVMPLAQEDERLRAAVRAAADFLATPFGASAPSVAEGLAQQIKELYRQGRRPVAPESVQSRADRIALEQRCYQKRVVLGGPHLRALLLSANATGSATGPSIPAFLPERLSAELPLYPRFRARLLAEVHPPLDAQDTAPVALRVVALGRVVELAPRERGGR